MKTVTVYIVTEGARVIIETMDKKAASKAVTAVGTGLRVMKEEQRVCN